MKEYTYHLRIEDIDILVTKKPIKNLYLRIKKENGAVLISAPLEASDTHIRHFACERIDWIRKYQQKYARPDIPHKETPPASRAETEAQKRLLKKEVEALVAKWEPVMRVKVSGITVRQMKTRWGSCNIKTHHININLALAKKPPECLEYVVVHEMTHILEGSHNQVFWDYMSKFYPDWKRIRTYLSNDTAE